MAVMAVLATGCSGDDERTSQGPTSTAPLSTTSSTSAAPAGDSTTSSVVTTTAAADKVLSSTSRLRLDGIGPVRVGMTLVEASRAVGQRLRVDPDSGPDAYNCGFADAPAGVEASFMVIDGRIRRVDVSPPSGIATVSGVRLGASEAEVQRIYRGIQVEPHPYDPNGHYLVYQSPEPSQGAFLLIFETDGSRVTSFRAGFRDAVRAPEGCA